MQGAKFRVLSRLLIALLLACVPSGAWAQLFDGDNGWTQVNSIPHIDTSTAHFLKIASSLSCTGDSDGRILIKTGTPSVPTYCDANDAQAYIPLGDSSGNAASVKGAAADQKRYLSVQDNTAAISDGSNLQAGWTHIFPMAGVWYYCSGATCTPVKILGDTTTAAGDILVRNSTGLTVLGIGAAPDGSVLQVHGSDPTKVWWGTLQYQVVMAGTGNCGLAASYLSGNGGCNSTESAVHQAFTGPTTITAWNCTQATDTTCVTTVQLRKNDADASGSASCDITNLGTCGRTGLTIAFTSSDTMDIKVVDKNTTCTDTIPLTCYVIGTQP